MLISRATTTPARDGRCRGVSVSDGPLRNEELLQGLLLVLLVLPLMMLLLLLLLLMLLLLLLPTLLPTPLLVMLRHSRSIPP
jgi:hypothetical protein